MLTQSQLDWLCKKQNELIHYFESNIPLTDKNAEEVKEWVASTVDLAKGKKTDCRSEVRSALFDVVEVYAFADPQYKAVLEKYGIYEESFKRMMSRWSEEQKKWFNEVGSNGQGKST